ncbi:hypothetical protein BpHYR1_031030 [Brachionus plicatilis]|uniref:Uncharacterized protein n=1 Tax=Brachionus plicatilis TaxID=10195 RepID=A0A3M7P8A2_BRAPC|nr:hypothetical protein BpHYR1_031030 [Brachionus plicatilis]
MSENTKNKKSTMLCLNENCIRNDNHYSKLISYQDKQRNENIHYIDILSGLSYNMNMLNLILFTDAVHYNKSGVDSMWVILLAIAELPPFLRN